MAHLGSRGFRHWKALERSSGDHLALSASMRGETPSEFEKGPRVDDPDNAAPVPPPLPAGLPVPVNDGAADHLTGTRIPSLHLAATDGGEIDLHELASRRLIVFVFPKIGRPDIADPPGWDAIPGARGCTQESCAYRDLYLEFVDLGHEVIGLSCQPLADLLEAKTRLHVPYRFVADPDGRLSEAVG